MTAPVAPRPLRKDAARNREAIVAAAHTAIREHGGGVDVREIARRAGVGMGTLYRHFPAKEDLVTEVLHEQFTSWATSARATAAAAEDPWIALTGFFYSALAGCARQRPLMDSMAIGRSDEDTAELAAIMAELLVRAQQAGLVRPGVTPGDLQLMLHALSATVQITEKCRPGTWRRTAQITLDGLRAVHQESLS
ncbi:TetR/AcrR family transcriptional regulator [Actinoplanes sp. NPDC051494]|uniref:TetR/AcrR family transcriptional regulator n=1 Tax=Actinoplanes sp. NPDC051494 TaxID=3363907 RepID=UPI0037AA4B01